MSPKLAQTFVNEPKSEVILNFKIRNLARFLQKTTNKQTNKNLKCMQKWNLWYQDNILRHVCPKGG